MSVTLLQRPSGYLLARMKKGKLNGLPENVLSDAWSKFSNLTIQRFGLVSAGQDLPQASTVVRYAGFGQMFKDSEDNVLGPSISAFQKRPKDDCLSVTWCEFFDATSTGQLRCAIEALRNSNKNIAPKGCFCIADANSILLALADHGGGGRAVFLPEDDNPAHSGIFGISSEETQLLEKLASETWKRFLTKETADCLPHQHCIKAANVA